MFISVLLPAFLAVSVYAEDKQWSGAGDAVTWEDKVNWSPQEVPTAEDNVYVNAENADAYILKAFKAKSLTVGGSRESNLTVNDFISGIVTPSQNTDDAIYLRKDGLLTLSGSGVMTAKGQIKIANETREVEASFMFHAE